MFIFLVLIAARVVQSFFVDGITLLELKWLLLGEWLADGHALYRETYDYTAPLAAIIYQFLDVCFGRSPFAHHVVSSLFIIVQAGIFNNLMIRNKALDENNYLPAFFYVLMMVCIPDFMSLSPQLMSMTFILLAMSQVLKRMSNQARDHFFLGAGLLTGIATMIYLPAFVFLLLFLLCLIAFTSAITRRLVLYVVGFVLVHLVFIWYFYAKGDLYYFWQFYYRKGLLLKATTLMPLPEILAVSSVFFLILMITVFKAMSAGRLTSFQQKVRQVIWFVFFGGFCCFWLSNRKSALELIFMVPLFSYFLSYYFIVLKRRFWKATMPGIVVFGMLMLNSYYYQAFSGSMSASSEREDSKDVMVLGTDLSFYAKNPVNSPCFDSEVSTAAFAGLGYYSRAAHIYEWFMSVEPSMVQDREGVFPEMMARFPELQRMYVEAGDGYYLKTGS